MDKIILDDIEVEVHKKRVRNIRLKICAPDGKVVLTAPILMTKREIICFLVSRIDWIRKHREIVFTRVSKIHNLPVLYSPEQFASIISQLMNKYCTLYNEPNVSFKLRKMKSHWGSCTPAKRSITFNTELAKHPIECIEYVVVHELCHLQIPNHGVSFKALMTQRLPDWKLRKKLLNNGC